MHTNRAVPTTQQVIIAHRQAGSGGRRTSWILGCVHRGGPGLFLGLYSSECNGFLFEGTMVFCPMERFFCSLDYSTELVTRFAWVDVEHGVRVADA